MLGIILGLILLIVLAYRGWSIIWVAPLAAGVVALFGDLDFIEMYTGTYMTGLANFIRDWFPLFILGAIFGKLMEVTEGAKAIAKKVAEVLGKERAMLGVILASAILTYGGVSNFVVIFAIYPIAIELFREADISKKLLVPSVTLGIFTFTMTAVPGTPQIQNFIPMPYFNTTPMAAPTIGLVTAGIMGVGGYLWLVHSEKKMRLQGIGFTDATNFEKVARLEALDYGAENPHWFLSLIPLLLVIIFLNLFQLDPIYALLIGIISLMIFNIKEWRQFVAAINEGGRGSVQAIINTSAAVGFGAVIASVPAFENIATTLFNISDNPLISQALSIQVMSMITGSASGGLGITLSTLGDTFYQLSETSGINPEVFHRIATLASGACVLPNNGSILTLLAVAGLSHKETYKHNFMIGLLIPTIALIVGIILGTMGVV